MTNLFKKQGNFDMNIFQHTTRRNAYPLALLLLLLVALTACGRGRQAEPSANMSASEATNATAAADNASTDESADEAESESNAEQSSAPASGAVQQVGTIEAMLDGEPQTWYAVAGEIEGSEQATALWTVLDGEPQALIGGFDTTEVPFDTFRRESGMLRFGDFTASQLLILFSFDMDDTSLTVDLDLTDADASLTYAPNASLAQDAPFANAYIASDGTLSVTRIEAREDDPARFEGTFSGTLQRMDEAGEAIEITDGRFVIDEAMFFALDDAAVRAMDAAASEAAGSGTLAIGGDLYAFALTTCAFGGTAAPEDFILEGEGITLDNRPFTISAEGLGDYIDLRIAEDTDEAQYIQYQGMGGELPFEIDGQTITANVTFRYGDTGETMHGTFSVECGAE